MTSGGYRPTWTGKVLARSLSVRFLVVPRRPSAGCRGAGVDGDDTRSRAPRPGRRPRHHLSDSPECRASSGAPGGDHLRRHRSGDPGESHRVLQALGTARLVDPGDERHDHGERVGVLAARHRLWDIQSQSCGGRHRQRVERALRDDMHAEESLIPPSGVGVASAPQGYGLRNGEIPRCRCVPQSQTSWTALRPRPGRGVRR